MLLFIFLSLKNFVRHPQENCAGSTEYKCLSLSKQKRGLIQIKRKTSDSEEPSRGQMHEHTLMGVHSA